MPLLSDTQLADYDDIPPRKLINDNLYHPHEIADLPLFFYSIKAKAGPIPHLSNSPFYFDDFSQASTAKVTTILEYKKFHFRRPEIFNLYNKLGLFPKVGGLEYYCPVLTLSKESLDQKKEIEFRIKYRPLYSTNIAKSNLKRKYITALESTILVRAISSHPDQIKVAFKLKNGLTTDQVTANQFTKEQTLLVEFSAGEYFSNQSYFIELKLGGTKVCGRIDIPVHRETTHNFAIFFGHKNNDDVSFTQYYGQSPTPDFSPGWDIQKLDTLVENTNKIFAQASKKIELFKEPVTLYSTNEEELGSSHFDVQGGMKKDLNTLKEIYLDKFKALNYIGYIDDTGNIIKINRKDRTLFPIVIWPDYFYADPYQSEKSTTAAMAKHTFGVLASKLAKDSAWNYLLAHELGHYFGLRHTFFDEDDNPLPISEYVKTIEMIISDNSEFNTYKNNIKQLGFLNGTAISAYGTSFNSSHTYSLRTIMATIVTGFEKYKSKNLMDYSNTEGGDQTMIEINYAQQQILKALE